MRKIGSAQEIEDKKKKNMIYISIFMLAVLVFGTVGYAFSSYLGSSSDEENQIVAPEGKFAVEFEGQNFYLSHSFEEVKEIQVDTSIDVGAYVGKTLYIDAEEPTPLSDALQFFSRYSNRIQEACYGSCERDIPEKECSENIIILRESEENKVYQEENCIFIDGNDMAVDAFLYKIMGIQ